MIDTDLTLEQQLLIRSIRIQCYKAIEDGLIKEAIDILINLLEVEKRQNNGLKSIMFNSN
jgi:hypothetical protein